MVNTSVVINDRPSAFRYPRGSGVGVDLPSISETLEIGKGRVIKMEKSCISQLWYKVRRMQKSF